MAVGLLEEYDLDVGRRRSVDLIRTSVSGAVMTIVLDDVPRRNALSRQMVTELLAAIDQGERNPLVRVVVVTNEGTVFCAGADLTESSHEQLNDSTGRTSELSEVFSRIMASPKPFVGRLNGHCVAGGVGLAAVMDISIAVSHAKFGFTEVRVGVAPAIISVVCLPKMRQADASAAFLRGTQFLADEAVRMGLINLAVTPQELDDEVTKVVSDLLAGEPTAIAVAKKLTRDVPKLSVSEALAWTSALSAELFTSEAAREGMAAYLEKRPAPWVQ